ncbi:MAG: transcription elongation factor GreA [Methylococcaceae bacterium]|nr:transcription elongation factor GreA [Methylococcaceae bacterium]
MKKVPLTVKGAEKLRAELEELKTVVRPRIIASIATEQQSFAEGRIAEIEGKLSNAQIIDITKVDANGKVVFGATVEIEDIESEKRVTYQIVGEDEASIKEGRISIGSPIARALIGKEVEDVVTVKAPGGNVDYEIISIKYI